MRACVHRIVLLLLLLTSLSAAAEAADCARSSRGTGGKRAELTAEREKDARATLERALKTGYALLRKGRSSLDAVEAAIMVLEDARVFNAGRGSVLNADGAVEMDASIMDGATRQAGAVGSVKTVRNPIRLARLVMTKTPHVFLISDGAEALARQHGLRFESPEWFITPAQQMRLQQAKEKHGTVGAVALDKNGHLAAGTSTGGLVNKLHGRIGDSPIIGAGTYAEDGVCAVSCTGQGEFFIRNVVAYDVAARMKHGNSDLVTATCALIHNQLPAQGGRGGLIALDAQGNISAPFNTESMFRAWITADGKAHVAIFEP